MSPCPLPFSTSGSISPRPIPIRPPCGSLRWPSRPRSRCAFARSCSGRSSRRRAGPRRHSISIPPRAATCGAISSGCVRIWPCRSGVRIRSRKTACWRPASRWPVSTGVGAKTSVARSSTRNSAKGGGSMTPRPSATCLPGCRSTRGQCLQRPNRMRSRCGYGARPKRRSSSACSARRASRPPTANCSGATTGSSPRSAGRSGRIERIAPQLAPGRRTPPRYGSSRIGRPARAM